jgi:hypothetical protein
MKQQLVPTDIISVPTSAIPLIMLQRLEVQGFGGKLHYTTLGHLAYKIYELIPFSQDIYRAYTTRIESRLRGPRIVAEYARVMHREFKSIVDWLPERPQKIVGIGPGVAGLEAYIAKYLESEEIIPVFFLVDQSRVDDVYYGFHERAAVYNSLDIAAQLLVDNGHPIENVICVEGSSSSDVTSIREVDLITSLISWGFHYPVETYIDFAIAALSPQGRLILDVRKDTGGIELLKDAFAFTQTIMSDPKFDRVMCMKSH